MLLNKDKIHSTGYLEFARSANIDLIDIVSSEEEILTMSELHNQKLCNRLLCTNKNL